MSQRDRVVRNIALGLAAAALAIVLIAVIVVGTRSRPADAETAHAVQELPPRDISVAAADVAKLGEPNKIEAIGGGVRVADTPLATALGLGADDVITSISGHEVATERDMHEAIYQVSMLKVHTLYVELLRDHGPGLVRWRLDTDLRTARRAALPNLYSGVIGGLAGTSPPPPPDPLLDTIRMIDTTHVELPAATVKTLLANPTALMRTARLVPAVGSTRGWKLYAIRPSSVLERLGVQNGDTVQTINGKDLSSPSQALDAWAELPFAKQVTVKLVRRGQPLTLEITVN